MDINGSIALVTGANRGIGRHFAQQLLDGGAAKVYAAAREVDAIDLPGVEPLRLDITDPAQVTAAVEAAGDVTLLVNNAGVSTGQGLLAGDPDGIRLEMETHFFGTLAVVRGFAPVLGRGGGGAIVNMLSALSWLAFPGAGAYGAAKAAEWSLTDSVRLELAAQGTQVVGVHVGAVDTRMMAGWDIPKTDPADVVRAALDGLRAGASEVVVDDSAAQAKAVLGLDPADRYPGLATAR